jgi:hypothetical protein
MSDYGDGRPLDVIHFTLGATDPIVGRRAHGVRVVVLADGGGADETSTRIVSSTLARPCAVKCRTDRPRSRASALKGGPVAVYPML